MARTLNGEDGPVPGHLGWHATFHEGTRGAVIEMDFGEHQGEDVDPWFFAARISAAQNERGVEDEEDAPLWAASHLKSRRRGSRRDSDSRCGDARHSRAAPDIDAEGVLEPWPSRGEDASSTACRWRWLHDVRAAGRPARRRRGSRSGLLAAPSPALRAGATSSALSVAGLSRCRSADAPGTSTFRAGLCPCIAPDELQASGGLSGFLNLARVPSSRP